MELESSEGDEAGADAFEVWPENERALELFLGLQSQMRVAVGLAGMVHLGLDAAAVKASLELRRLSRAERERLFDELLEMGQAAAAVMNRRHGG